jgi:hypothetical protein
LIRSGSIRSPSKVDRDADLRRRRSAFIAEELEQFPGVFMMTAEPWAMWQKRCAMRGDEYGDQRSFSQHLREHFDHDPNNGRPRFLNVRAKQKAPKLSVVRSSG